MLTWLSAYCMEERGQPDEVPYGRVVRAAVWHPSDLCLVPGMRPVGCGYFVRDMQLDALNLGSGDTCRQLKQHVHAVAYFAQQPPDI